MSEQMNTLGGIFSNIQDNFSKLAQGHDAVQFGKSQRPVVPPEMEELRETVQKTTDDFEEPQCRFTQ